MKEKFYITTAIDYINGEPHIGHMLEKIQADVFARYARMTGKSVFFLTGADEHGSKNQKKAEEEGITPRKLAQRNSAAFKGLKKLLNLSWDDFIRTSDQKKHWPGVIKIWKELEKSGDIYKQTYRGLYCVGCEAFLTDKDMENGQCIIHKREPQLIEEENYFFRLSAYAKQIKKKIENKDIEIIPQTRSREVLALIDQGLSDVSFSRSSQRLTWGIPVPGDQSQTMYVWADALTNYISAIGYGRDAATFKKWWPADMQVIGKDILRFHAAIWPAMLMSAKLPLPKKLFVHGHITVEGEKMSKSIGNVISPADLVHEFGTDPIRYYFIREISPFEDGDYSRIKFIDRYNADLANGLGNMVARVFGLVHRLPTPLKSDLKMVDLLIEQKIKAIQKQIHEHMAQCAINDALSDVWSLIAFGDYYINDKKPWSKEHPAIENEKTLLSMLVLIQSIAIFLEPFMPATAQKIAKAISFKGKAVAVKDVPPLFPRLEG